MDTEFKKCPMCGKRWASRGDFLGDRELDFNGYQPDFDSLENGFFYFTHEVHGCGSTMLVEAGTFFPLYSGPRYSESKQLSEDCPRLCLDRDRLERCTAHCKFAFAREVSELIQNRFDPAQASTAEFR